MVGSPARGQLHPLGPSSLVSMCPDLRGHKCYRHFTGVSPSLIGDRKNSGPPSVSTLFTEGRGTQADVRGTSHHATSPGWQRGDSRPSQAATTVHWGHEQPKVSVSITTTPTSTHISAAGRVPQALFAQPMEVRR